MVTITTCQRLGAPTPGGPRSSKELELCRLPVPNATFAMTSMMHSATPTLHHGAVAADPSIACMVLMGGKSEKVYLSSSMG